MRWMMGRTTPSSLKPISWRTRPSRGLKPTRNCQPIHSTALPLSVKLGPLGWTTLSGFSPGRVVSELPERVVFTGRMPVSVTSMTVKAFMSTVATMPSIGRSYGFGRPPSKNDRARSSLLPGGSGGRATDPGAHTSM